MQENWEKYGEENVTESEDFFKLENLKKLFLSQRFITTFLRSLKMFEKWTLNSLEKLLYSAEMKTLSKNEHIFSQGDEANGFYIVFRGDILISYKIKNYYYEKLAFDYQTLNSTENQEITEDQELTPIKNDEK